MKTTAPDTLDKEQDLQRFNAAADRLVQRARQDPEVAREFLAATGYFEVMSKACAISALPTPKTAVKVNAGRTKRRSHKGKP